MTAKADDGTTGEKLSDNIFARVDQPEGSFDAGIDVNSFGGGDDATEIVVTIGPMEVTINLSPEQSRELRSRLEEAEGGHDA